MAEKGTAAYCFKPNYKRSELGAPGIASRRKDATRTQLNVWEIWQDVSAEAAEPAVSTVDA